MKDALFTTPAGTPAVMPEAEEKPKKPWRINFNVSADWEKPIKSYAVEQGIDVTTFCKAALMAHMDKMGIKYPKP